MDGLIHVRSLLFVICLFVHDTDAASRIRRQVPNELDPRIQDDLVTTHNLFRQRVEPGSSNMRKLVWNDDLADLAQEMAFDCRDREGDLTAPGSADYSEMAQNRYTTRNSMNVEGGMRVWNRQGDDYDYARGRCDRNRNCDEYVKMVWAETYEMGCAIAQCEEFDFLVCNYGPGGDVNDGRPYRDGNPCSECSDDFGQCEDDLCVESEDIVDPVSLPIACDFERDNTCDLIMALPPAAVFEWRTNSGTTGTRDTGPDSGYNSDFYLYTEASSRGENDNAILSTPPVDRSGPSCISFAYHMYGNAVGTLRVYLTMNDEEIINESGDQGNQWIPVRREVFLRAGQQVVFEGIISRGSGSDIAIDELLIESGSCISSTNLPLQCGFEDDFCDFVQPIDNDDIEWLRLAEATPTSRTGPDFAYAGEWFIYIETSRGSRGEGALLETPPLSYSGDVCVRFAYHAYGNTIGRLRVSIKDTEDSLLEVASDRGNQWFTAELDATIASGDVIVFLGQKGTDSRSDIGLDAISIEEGSCGGGNPQTTQTPTTAETTPDSQQIPRIDLPLECNFERSFCDLIQSEDDSFDWDRDNDNTPSSNTGPGSGYNSDWFAFIEASSQRPEAGAQLETPRINYSGEICVEFAYHMYGDDIGRLRAFIKGTSDAPLREDGSKGDQWHYAQLNFNIRRNQQIAILATKGDNNRGDIAIDELTIREGRCEGDATVAPPPGGLVQPPTGEAEVVCDFERVYNNEDCRIRQDDRDDLDWDRRHSKTPSGDRHERKIDGRKYPITGPNAAEQGGYYLYLETSEGRAEQVARLFITDSMFGRENGAYCMTFQYSMNGFHVGRLAVLTKSDRNDDGSKRWELFGDQLHDWKRASIEIPDMDDLYEVVIEGETKRGVLGDMAIDDIQFSPNKCEELPRGSIFRCNFETSDGDSTFCDMEQQTDDDFDFSIWSGETHSEYTGPMEAQDGAYYTHIEASKPRVRDDEAILCFPVSTYNREVCVDFRYSMYGHHIGKLALLTRDSRNKNENVIWELDGRQDQDGSSWNQERQTIRDVEDLKICFRATVGNEYSGDIALDNIVVRDRRC